MTDKELLQQARALVSDHFTQKAYARTASGTSVSPLSPEAQCFCAFGAVIRAAGHDNVMWGCPVELLTPAAWLVLDEHRVRKPFLDHPVAFVNDRLGQAATLRMFDLAILEARFREWLQDTSSVCSRGRRQYQHQSLHTAWDTSPVGPDMLWWLVNGLRLSELAHRARVTARRELDIPATYGAGTLTPQQEAQLADWLRAHYHYDGTEVECPSK